MFEKNPYHPEPRLEVSCPPVISSLAIISLSLALISPFVLCACGFSALTSLIAIITGHVALVRIHHSAGQLVGRGLAIGGLVVGYLMFGISVAVLVVLIPAFQDGRKEGEQNVAQSDRPKSLDASKRLSEAERNVLTSGTNGVATGNSPAAVEMAKDYAELMKHMRDTLFTKDDSLGAALTDGTFVTHCELHDGRCAFIVHVPAYRNFDDGAKDTLAMIAWKVAQGTVDEELEPGDRLAVGLRGRLIYGAVLIGEVASEDEEEDIFERRERDDLLPFFTPSIVEATRPTDPEADRTKPEPGSTADRGTSAPVPERRTLPVLPEPVRPLTPDPGPESPNRIPIPPRTQPPAARTPTKSRPTAPTRKPGLMDGVPVSREVVQEFPEMGWGVESLAFAPHGRWLAAGKMDRKLLILNVATGATLSTAEKLDELSGVKQVAFSPDGQFVAAGGSSGAVFTWEIDSSGLLSNAQSLTRHGQRVQCLAMSPTAPFLMTGSSDGEVIWQSYASSTSTSRKQKAFPRDAKAVFLPPKGLEAMATDAGTLARIDLKTSKVIATREFPRSAAQAAAFSSDGGKLAVTAGYKIQVWDTTTGLSLGTLDGDREMQWSVAFLPGGNRLISGGRGFATLWDLETGKAECRFDLGGVLYIQTLAISPDGSLLAAIPASAGQKLSVLRIPE